MPNYKKMYFALFNAVSDSINNLQKAQQNAENAYIENEAPLLPVLPVKAEKEKHAPKA